MGGRARLSPLLSGFFDDVDPKHSLAFRLPTGLQKVGFSLPSHDL